VAAGPAAAAEAVVTVVEDTTADGDVALGELPGVAEVVDAAAVDDAAVDDAAVVGDTVVADAVVEDEVFADWGVVEGVVEGAVVDGFGIDDGVVDPIETELSACDCPLPDPRLAVPPAGVDEVSDEPVDDVTLEVEVEAGEDVFGVATGGV
jgi:hypothetical protein